MTAAVRTHYSAIAIVLHWAIALSILTLIFLGWWMGDAISEPGTQAQAAAAFQLHKSLGLTVLALSLVRLGVRLVNPPPPLPAEMTRWERTVAGVTHVAFYALIVLIPLTGWIYVSTGYTTQGEPLDVPTVWFGLFTVPDLPMSMPEEMRQNAAMGSMNVHGKLSWAALILAGLHAAAALKHHFVNKDGVLARMVPGLRPLSPTATVEAPRTPGRLVALGGGLGLVAFGAAAFALALLTLPKAAPADAAEAASIADDPALLLAEARVPQPAAAPAPAWTIDQRESAITFSGTHAGAAFEGRFTSWRGDVRFDPQNLAGSRAEITIETGSADLPDAVQEQTLKGGEWFDVANHPTARFVATRFRALPDGRYEALGVLTIKGEDTAVRLPFRFAQESGAARVEGEAVVNRVAAKLGTVSDPNAQWVARDIAVRIEVRATR